VLSINGGKNFPVAFVRFRATFASMNPMKYIAPVAAIVGITLPGAA
jgi:hypothetical protein